jgi:tRNA-splicing ligase RtcB
MGELWNGPLEKIDDYTWRIPQSYKPGMKVPGVIFADERLLKDIRHDKALEQVANVAFLPGIVNASLAMPDIHWGYGPCIGAVFATDIENGGIITPSGVGYDIIVFLVMRLFCMSMVLRCYKAICCYLASTEFEMF